MRYEPLRPTASGVEHLYLCATLTRSDSNYLDGVLPADLRRRIELHLGQCASCRAGVEQLRETTRLIVDYEGWTSRAVPDAPGLASS